MKEFPLTRKQARDYFLHEQEAQGRPNAVVGLATHSLDCPLVRAYSHYHPEDSIEIWPEHATINDTRYSLRKWHIDFVRETDANEHGRPVGADAALDILGARDE